MESPNTAEQTSTPPAESSIPPPESSSRTNQRSSDGPLMASTSAKPSSSGTNRPTYHVFINHCGRDTKETLADPIYQKLNATGLRVFLDKGELEPGDFFPPVLKDAIANASLHIAIFSQHYVESASCLDELALMLQTMAQTRAKFIPIFYHVEPSFLRWGFEKTRIYANDNNRYSGVTLQSWKSALHQASLYHGNIINSNKDKEEELVMNVVNRTFTELNNVGLDVAQHPMSLDEVEQDFNSIARESVGSIQIVGIWGMGGGGKTTLAKHLYNKKRIIIKRSSFLFDIREASSKRILHEKQEKLLKDLGLEVKNTKFNNVNEGKEILKNRLESISVLIVLDDVDRIDQLDALLPARDSLGHESLIIVTTRNESVLKEWKVSTTYKIREFNDFYAEELFCWHAFGQPSPVTDFKDLTREFVKRCCGLPLSLKVLGRLLSGELNKEYWQSQLDELSRKLPNDIKSNLEISYEALDEKEKEMFLDVACFFIGWTSNSAIAIWNGSKWSGLHGWQKLVNNCLVELDENNKIRMHDQLRDLGREIANKHSPYRLWSGDNEIQPQQGAIQIRGIADAFGHDNCYLSDGKIRLKRSQGELILAPGSLKIFIGQGDFINEGCRELFKELLCFSCVGLAHRNLPSWIPLEKLRILQLDKLWGFEDLNVPLQRLRSLEILTMHHCRKLNTLPSLGELTSLKEVDLKSWWKLEKIESLGGLRSLETLKIDGCHELNTLPSLAELTSLQEIDLNNCYQLKEIESLEGLRSLEILKIRECVKLNTLPNLAELTSLKVFYLMWCSKLEKIESLKGLRSLETLKVAWCEELNTLPNLAELTSLKVFHLMWCRNLEKIEGMEGLRSLKTLEMYDCPALDSLPNLAELISLENIKLIECEKVEKVEGLEVLRSLKKVEIQGRSYMLKLPEQSERLEWVEVAAARVVVEGSIRAKQILDRSAFRNKKLVLMPLLGVFQYSLP